MTQEDPAQYGELWAPVYDEEHAFLDPAPVVDVLAEMADGPVLELGIGTGRVALPLAARGVAVSGIDASPAMVDRMRAKPGGADIPVTIGDMAREPLGGPYGLVYVVFNTFFSLLNQARQIECLRNVARSLAPHGRLVLECFVPDLTRYRDGHQYVRALGLSGTTTRLNVAVHDPVNQIIDTNVLTIEGGTVAVWPVRIRYAWPSELDVMAQLAGLEIVDRWGTWAKTPFTPDSTQHISSYRQLD